MLSCRFRIAEQAENLRRAAPAGPVLEPGPRRLEGRILMRREFGHSVRETQKESLKGSACSHATRFEAS